jgi:flagella basal body P-ring formation protein FlgA
MRVGAVIAVAAAPRAWAGGAVECLPVHAESILAGDLAAANPVFASLDPKMPVGAAPMAGARRVFRGPELARLAKQNHLSTGNLRDACFEWPTRALKSEQLAQAMARVLGFDAAAIEVVEQSRFPAPPGDLVFEKAELEPLPGSGGRLMVWRGYVLYCPGRRFPIWARVRILAPTARVVARTALPAGEPIAESALESTVVTDGIAGGVYANSIGEVAGRVPRTRIEPGTAIRLSDLSSMPEIRAGDTVQVEVRNGAMRIRTVATAERSGRIGDLIPLTNPESATHFRARVEGKDKVVLVVGGR